MNRKFSGIATSPLSELSTIGASLLGNSALSEMVANSKFISEQIAGVSSPLSKLGISSLLGNSSVSEMLTSSKLLSERMKIATSPWLELPTIDSSLLGNSAFSEMLESSRLLSEQMKIVTSPLSELSTMGASLLGNSTLSEIVANSKFISEQIAGVSSPLSELGISSLLENLSSEQIDILTLSNEVELLEEKDETILNEIFQSLIIYFPEINQIKNVLSKKEYIKLTIILIFVTISLLNSVKGIYNNFHLNINNDYLINRNKVRIRTEPSTKSPVTIISKLNKNHYVERIDSYKNWVKVEFESEEGDLNEGWVRRDMLMKLEN